MIVTSIVSIVCLHLAQDGERERERERKRERERERETKRLSNLFFS